jgi:glycosyltransferase involved in cell wall biosynthesis
MRILLVTDAWSPQVNGVVHTLQQVRKECEAMGHAFEVVSPDRCRTMPCPTYPEIRLALRPRPLLEAMLDRRPDCVHIATEGPLGLAARAACLRRGMPFTTAYHTRFPEYLRARLPVPLRLGYAALRWFHRPSKGVMVATASLGAELAARGFANLRHWPRGVATDLFRPDLPPALALPRPICLYVGRVAVEKNVEAFLAAPLAAGSKVVVGDGPALAALRTRYPEVLFTGAKHGRELARHYAAADVFVFPSRTDTFGLVLLEALASGLPIAALPVPGPADVLGDSGCGVLDEDLGAAIQRALEIPRARCRALAERFSWRRCAELFLQHLHPLGI